MLNKLLSNSVLPVFSEKKKKVNPSGPSKNLLSLLYAQFLFLLYSALQMLAVSWSPQIPIPVSSFKKDY